MTISDRELERRIRTFFIYWRKRYEFIRRLDSREHHHEANVLIWAALDALSNLWAKNIGKNTCTQKGKRLIFNRFLSHYGGEPFQNVSLPDVWSRVDRGKTERVKLPKDAHNFLRCIGNRRPPTFLDERQLRQSTDDWDITKVSFVTLVISPQADRAVLESWLMQSQYGAISYKTMRSSYIHEGQPAGSTHSFELSRSSISPTYLSGIYTTPPTMGFSVDFMSRTLKYCIDAFETDALALNEDPAPY